jgi:excisionase family DNA binding protein
LFGGYVGPLSNRAPIDFRDSIGELVAEATTFLPMRFCEPDRLCASSVVENKKRGEQGNRLSKTVLQAIPQKSTIRGSRRSFLSISSVIEQLRKHTKAMKAKEVAALLNLDPDTVCRYADAQMLPAFKVGSRWRFDPAALVAWIEGQKAAQNEEQP